MTLRICASGNILSGQRLRISLYPPVTRSLMRLPGALRWTRAEQLAGSSSVWHDTMTSPGRVILAQVRALVLAWPPLRYHHSLLPHQRSCDAIRGTIRDRSKVVRHQLTQAVERRPAGRTELRSRATPHSTAETVRRQRPFPMGPPAGKSFQRDRQRCGCVRAKTGRALHRPELPEIAPASVALWRMQAMRR
jgi:hypothetical protein